jgi:hypothetical protein
LRAGDGDGGDRIGAPQLFGDGKFRLGRKVINRIDTTLDVIEKAWHCTLFYHHQCGNTAPFAGLTANLVQPDHTLGGIFQSTADGILDLGCSGPFVGDADLYLVILDLREGFAL